MTNISITTFPLISKAILAQTKNFNNNKKLKINQTELFFSVEQHAVEQIS